MAKVGTVATIVGLLGFYIIAVTAIFHPYTIVAKLFCAQHTQRILSNLFRRDEQLIPDG